MKTDSINNYIKKNYSSKRRIHTEGVRKTAIELANLYGADPNKAEIAALFHDMFRGVKDDELNNYVKEIGLDCHYNNNCNLSHGKIAAYIMQRDYEVNDSDIINAVSYHTTGRPGMSILEKVIFIADAIEPNRDYPGLSELRKISYEDIDKACLYSLNKTIAFLESEGKFLDKDTELARDYFLEKEKN